MSESIVLFDIDSKIPNLALMKISAYYKKQGFKITLSREIKPIKANYYFASTVFNTKKSKEIVEKLQNNYGDALDIGGSGFSLEKRLPDEIEKFFPDYKLYKHDKYAVGFLTRGCDRKCAFCLVPKKEGPKRVVSTLDDFVADNQSNVMLLDDNLLSFPESKYFLSEIIKKKYAVNFSQSLDITYLNEENYHLLKKVDSRNAKFTKKMYYFSCNNTHTIKEFIDRKGFLKELGEDSVTVIVMYGFNTHLSEDYKILRMLRSLRLVPFFQQYQPIFGVEARVPKDYFDFDLDEVIRLTFRSNGQNWEKYLRWLNKLYFITYGRYYYPLLEIIYRYNNKQGINKYLRNRDMLTNELYRKFGS